MVMLPPVPADRDLGGHRPEQTGLGKTGAAIYEAKRIAAARAKRKALKSQVPHLLHAHAANTQKNRSRWTPSDSMRNQPANAYLFSHSRPCRKSRADCRPRHRRPHCRCPTARPASTADSSIKTTYETSRTPLTDGPTSDVLSPSTITANTPTASNVDSVHTCPNCDRTSSSCIGLVGYLLIHCTKGGEPVTGAPKCTRRSRLSCPRTLTQRIGLVGRMRIHENLRQTTAG
nr:unnamed protein product [Spirometra erinaceieuropaei]